MNYKELFKKLDINNIDFTFCISEINIMKINQNDYNFLNNLAFAPVSLNSKKKVFDDLLHDKLTDIQKNEFLVKIYKFYDEFYNRYNSKRILIREFTRYIFNWIKINDIQIDTISKNIIQIENKMLVFYILHKFYNENLYTEIIVLLNKLFEKNYFTKNDEFYNDLLLYKLYSLKNNYKYIDDENTFQEVCKIAKNLYGFEYIRIITLLECRLKEDNILDFREILDKHFTQIEEWEIDEILNLYELSIYIKDIYSIEKIENLLHSKDIELFLNDSNALIFSFLQAIKNNDKEKIKEFKIKLKNQYDFSHYKEFYKIKKR